MDTLSKITGDEYELALTFYWTPEIDVWQATEDGGEIVA
jgi:hypothetical protein